MNGHKTGIILNAIGVVLKNSYLQETSPYHYIREGTFIQIEVLISGVTYLVTAEAATSKKSFEYRVSTSESSEPGVDFYLLIKQSQEREKWTCFSSNNKSLYQEYLKEYKNHEKKELSETETIVFEFLLYININMFWQRYDSILDKHIEWPLFIKDFVEMLDKKVDVSKLIKYAIELKRQTILLIQNEDNETNYYVQ